MTGPDFDALMMAVRREILAADIRCAIRHDRSRLPALYAEARKITHAALDQS